MQKLKKIIQKYKKYLFQISTFHFPNKNQIKLKNLNKMLSNYENNDTVSLISRPSLTPKDRPHTNKAIEISIIYLINYNSE